jgi:hypothetical protein
MLPQAIRMDILSVFIGNFLLAIIKEFFMPQYIVAHSGNSESPQLRYRRDMFHQRVYIPYLIVIPGADFDESAVDYARET